mmetsp:Transcript_15158/g.28243  ORF Transcript_15158/g.28243 Transcript_15158/m.28243 type:complete len:237 (+) Transcript_15158:1457-2167(+)
MNDSQCPYCMIPLLSLYLLKTEMTTSPAQSPLMCGTSTLAEGWGGSAITLSVEMSCPRRRKERVMGCSISSLTSCWMRAILFFCQASMGVSFFSFFFFLPSGELPPLSSLRASGVMAEERRRRRVEVFCMASWASSTLPLLLLFSKFLTAFSLSSVAAPSSPPSFFFFFFFFFCRDWSPGGGAAPAPEGPLVTLRRKSFLQRCVMVLTQVDLSSLVVVQSENNLRWGWEIQNSQQS